MAKTKVNIQVKKSQLRISRSNKQTRKKYLSLEEEKINSQTILLSYLMII